MTLAGRVTSFTVMTDMAGICGRKRRSRRRENRLSAAFLEQFLETNAVFNVAPSASVVLTHRKGFGALYLICFVS